MQDKLNILRKMADIMADTGWIQKDGTVQISKVSYDYASESQFIAELRPLLVKYKVILVPVGVKELSIKEKVTLSSNGNSSVSYITTAVFLYRFYDAESGEYIEVEMPGQGADTTDKGIYKLATGAFKYVLRQTFMIGTGDDPERTDENNKSVANIDQSKRQDLSEYIRRTQDALAAAEIDYGKLARDLKDYGLIPNGLPYNATKLRAIYNYAKSIADGKSEESALTHLKNALSDE